MVGGDCAFHKYDKKRKNENKYEYLLKHKFIFATRTHQGLLNNEYKNYFITYTTTILIQIDMNDYFTATSPHLQRDRQDGGRSRNN